mmetsp:Transcript_39543/g.104372  ORF Transcript_39543/g.104372 Transcript_39543/m.104372 type:complete len:264 (+) Transcript_39543:905-1696(+)
MGGTTARGECHGGVLAPRRGHRRQCRRGAWPDLPPLTRRGRAACRHQRRGAQRLRLPARGHVELGRGVPRRGSPATRAPLYPHRALRSLPPDVQLGDARGLEGRRWGGRGGDQGSVLRRVPVHAAVRVRGRGAGARGARCRTPRPRRPLPSRRPQAAVWVHARAHGLRGHRRPYHPGCRALGCAFGGAQGAVPRIYLVPLRGVRLAPGLRGARFLATSPPRDYSRGREARLDADSDDAGIAAGGGSHQQAASGALGLSPRDTP